jgi:hypothetical protein
MVAATPGWRRPGRSRLADGEEWRGEDHEHERGVLNWLEGSKRKEAHWNRVAMATMARRWGMMGTARTRGR